MLHPEEMLSSHVLPVRRDQAACAGAPKLVLKNVPVTSQVRMAGNCMNLPCLGVAMLYVILSFDKIDKTSA